MLGPLTGVGRLVDELVPRLARRADLELVAFAMTWRLRQELGRKVPSGVRAVRAPIPARPARACWKRLDLPPLRWWTGPVDVVHGPNFVVPPSAPAREVLTVHDLTVLHYPEMCTRDALQYPTLIRRALGRGALVHAVSEAVGAEVVDAFGVEAERVVVVPNGVTAPGEADPARGHLLTGAERYVLALGTVEPRKDLPTLVRAFAAVAADDPDLSLVVAGPEGWGEAAFRAAVDACGVAERVRRLPWLPEDDRAAVLHGASVLAYPSVYEGFGLPPLEAMAAGVPVVTTTAGALPEVVGEAARTVTPGDADALAVALHDVLGDPALRSRLAAAGRDRAARYSWDDTAAGIAALYRRLAP